MTYSNSTEQSPLTTT